MPEDRISLIHRHFSYITDTGLLNYLGHCMHDALAEWGVSPQLHRWNPIMFITKISSRAGHLDLKCAPTSEKPSTR
jgi:hypothetical protein